MVEWLSSWFAEQGSRVHALDTLISDIQYLLLLSRNMTERLLKRSKILKITRTPTSYVWEKIVCKVV